MSLGSSTSTPSTSLGRRALLVSAFVLVLSSALVVRAETAKRFELDRVSTLEASRWSRLSKTIPAAKGLKIFWWNIANGASEADPDVLRANLELLASSPLAPDVIALGEFSSRSLPEPTYSQLASKYPHRTFIRYNAGTSTGIAVFSKHAMTPIRAASFRWIPSALSEEQAADYRESWAPGHADGGDGFYVRPLRELRLDVEGKSIAFTPIHLAQPWRELGKRSDGTIDFALATLSELYFGTENPLITQVNVLVNWLKAGTNANRVLVGDFNLPRSFVGVPTLGFRRLDRVLEPAITQVENSFPTPSSPHSYPPMQIDHAFVSGQVSAPVAGVLPLKGSDHYPLYVIVR